MNQLDPSYQWKIIHKVMRYKKALPCRADNDDDIKEGTVSNFISRSSKSQFPTYIHIELLINNKKTSRVNDWRFPSIFCTNNKVFP